MASSTHALGHAIFLGILGLTALLERFQFYLRATESSKWWASNGRDVVNAFALGSMVLGLRALGFYGPLVLAIAATFVILMTALQSVLGEGRMSLVLSVASALVLGLPILAAPRAFDSGFRALLSFLFR